MRFRTIEPSFAESSTMSASPSFLLMVTTAMRSPEGEGAIDKAWEYCVFSWSGAKSVP